MLELRLWPIRQPTTPLLHFPMLLARVEGNVTATRKHPSFEGWRLVICQPIGRDGTPEGSPQIANDKPARRTLRIFDRFACF